MQLEHAERRAVNMIGVRGVNMIGASPITTILRLDSASLVHKWSSARMCAASEQRGEHDRGKPYHYYTTAGQRFACPQMEFRTKIVRSPLRRGYSYAIASTI